MTRPKIALAVAVAAAEAAGAIAVVVPSNHDAHKALALSLALTAGFSFVVSGLIALHLRPDNRTGVYLAAIGFLWFLLALSDANNKWLLTGGVMLSNLGFIPFAALILSFPSGKLDAFGRRVVWFTTVFVVIGAPSFLLFDEQPANGCNGGDCPHSAIVVYKSARIANGIDAASAVIVIALIAVVVFVLVRRWRRATVAARRVLRPVYYAGVATLLTLSLTNLLSQIDEHANVVLGPIFLALFATVPFAFLLGILRSRLALGSVGELVVSVDHGATLRDAAAEALGDPSLSLAFWLEDPQRFVDLDGRPLDLANVGERAATIVERDGRRVGALLHDESLLNEPELLESVVAAVALTLDNERLQAEVRAQHKFLTTIVDTAPSLLVSVDTEGRIRTLNPATLVASGHASSEEVRGRLFWDVFIDPHERAAMEARFHAAPDHPPSEYENTFTNARGERLSIIWRGAPVTDPSGKVESIVAAGLDVTEHREQEVEIRASRARIVAAGDDARRVLERNLHDGAQQRLVSLSLSLRLAQSKLDADPAATAAILAGASEELAHALEELRELARGIHPAVLTDRGLGPALEALAVRTPVPVDVTALDRRLPEPIEAAAYYVVSESIANVVKHAEASAVTVRLEAVDGAVRIEVADDGIGGADTATGSGLRGLADRVAALDGHLSIESPEGRGTIVIAEIPLREGS